MAISKFLTNDEVVARAPSVATRMPHPDASPLYSHINTLEVVESLGELGWRPVRAREQFVRDKSHQGFQKHEVAFRHTHITPHNFKFGPTEHRIEVDNADEVFELLVTNSHNRLSAWHLYGGIHVQVCSNGLVISKSHFADIKIPHRSITRGEILNLVAGAANCASNALMAKDEMKQIELTDGQRLDFAERALLLKYKDRESIPIRPQVLLEPRRREDEGRSLWKTYQVSQENLIRGLQRDPERRDVVGRMFGPSVPVTAIDRSLEINQGLWDLSCEYMNN